MIHSDDQDIRIVEKEFLEILNQLRALRGESAVTELPEPPYCSFCGRGNIEVGALVAGINAHICASCANEARQLLLRGE
jgi:hypothetical protein